MSQHSINPAPDRPPVNPAPALAHLLGTYLRAVQLANTEATR